jgi:hypothetical protein
MAASAPDLVTAVIGFRQWRLCGDELWSVLATERWHRGVQSAYCAVHTHEAPANGCTCGIYAWYTPVPLPDHPFFVATAFQPQVGSSESGVVPALIAALLDAAAARRPPRVTTT